MLAEGAVLIVPICGVMGFICDGTNDQAIHRIYELKNRNRAQTLITAASLGTLRRITDLGRLPPTWSLEVIASIYDLPVLVIFPAANDLPTDVIIRDPNEPNEPNIQTIAVWVGKFLSANDVS